MTIGIPGAVPNDPSVTVTGLVSQSSILSVNTEDSEIDPIYLGINRTKPGRVQYQFKGDDSLYGCKLPIEGRV